MCDEKDGNHHMDCVCCKGGNMRTLIDESIEKKGCAIIPVNSDPQIAYTVGLTEKGIPEFIVVGNFGMKQLADIIATSVEHLMAHRDAFMVEEVTGVIQVMVHDELIDGLLGCRRMEEEYKELFGWMPERYKHFSARQLIFPDPHGKLPWHADFNSEWNQKSKQRCLYSLDENEK